MMMLTSGRRMAVLLTHWMSTSSSCTQCIVISVMTVAMTMAEGIRNVPQAGAWRSC